MERILNRVIISLGVFAMVGCSSSAGFSINLGPLSGNAKTASSKEPTTTGKTSNESAARASNIAIWMDGQKAEATAVRTKIANPISTTPTLRFEITNPEKVGEIRSTIINIFTMSNSGTSNHAEYIVMAGGGASHLQPGKEYNFAAGSNDLMIMDEKGNTMSTMKLKSGQKYLMNFVVSAGTNETVGVEFTTK